MLPIYLHNLGFTLVQNFKICIGCFDKLSVSFYIWSKNCCIIWTIVLDIKLNRNPTSKNDTGDLFPKQRTGMHTPSVWFTLVMPTQGMCDSLIGLREWFHGTPNGWKGEMYTFSSQCKLHVLRDNCNCSQWVRITLTYINNLTGCISSLSTHVQNLFVKLLFQFNLNSSIVLDCKEEKPTPSGEERLNDSQTVPKVGLSLW